jgi:hypothetical protein
MEEMLNDGGKGVKMVRKIIVERKGEEEGDALIGWLCQDAVEFCLPTRKREGSRGEKIVEEEEWVIFKGEEWQKRGVPFAKGLFA